MTNRTKEDETEAGGGASARAAGVVRLLDACIHALERVRNRLRGVEEEETPARGGGRHSDAAAAPALPASAAPQQKSLLRRFLIILLCLLLGGGAGSLFSYRLFSTSLAAHGDQIDRLQEEIDQSKKAESISANARIKYQREANENRKAMLEAQQANEDLKTELAGAKRQIDELTNQLQPKKPAARPAARLGRAASPAASNPVPAKKTATCVAGSANAADTLKNCIEEFNRQ